MSSRSQSMFIAELKLGVLIQVSSFTWLKCLWLWPIFDFLSLSNKAFCLISIHKAANKFFFCYLNSKCKRIREPLLFVLRPLLMTPTGLGLGLDTCLAYKAERLRWWRAENWNHYQLPFPSLPSLFLPLMEVFKWNYKAVVLCDHLGCEGRKPMLRAALDFFPLGNNEMRILMECHSGS